MLTLYDCTTAPSPRRTRILLAEKDIEYICKQVDLTKGEQMGEAFATINPRRAVPALVTEKGDVICENTAIAIYLDEEYPNTNFTGTDALSKARISEWNWRCEYEGLMAIAEIFRNTSPNMKNRALTGRKNIPQIPELADRGRIRLEAFWEDLDQQLQNNSFVAGETYSFADITAQVSIDFARWVKASPDETYTALNAWHKTVSARPSAKA